MTMTTMQQLVTAAEQALGIAISVSPSGRAYYLADETGDAYWLTRRDLRYAVECAEYHKSDVYSHWCAGSGREMAEATRRQLCGR